MLHNANSCHNLLNTRVFSNLFLFCLFLRMKEIFIFTMVVFISFRQKVAEKGATFLKGLQKNC